MSVFPDVFDNDINFIALAPGNKLGFILTPNPLDLLAVELACGIGSILWIN